MNICVECEHSRSRGTMETGLSRSCRAPAYTKRDPIDGYLWDASCHDRNTDGDCKEFTQRPPSWLTRLLLGLRMHHEPRVDHDPT